MSTDDPSVTHALTLLAADAQLADAPTLARRIAVLRQAVARFPSPAFEQLPTDGRDGPELLRRILTHDDLPPIFGNQRASIAQEVLAAAEAREQETQAETQPAGALSPTQAHALLAKHSAMHGKATESTLQWLVAFAHDEPERFKRLYHGGVNHTDLHPLDELRGEQGTADLKAAAGYLKNHLEQHRGQEEEFAFQPGMIANGLSALPEWLRSVGHHYDDLGRMAEALINRQPKVLYRDQRKPKLGADQLDLQTGLHIHPGENWAEIGVVLAFAASSAVLTDHVDLPEPIKMAIKASGSWPLFNSLIAGELEHAVAHLKDRTHMQDAVKQVLLTLMLGLGIVQKDGAHTMLAAHSMAVVLRGIGNIQTDALSAALGALESIVAGLPETAEVIHGDHSHSHSADDLRVGQRIALNPRQQAPVDVKIVGIEGPDGKPRSSLWCDTYWSHGQTRQEVGIGEALAQGSIPLEEGVKVIAEVTATRRESSLFQRYEQQKHYKPSEQQSMAKRIGNGWVWGTLAVTLLAPVNYVLQRVWRKEGIDIDRMIHETGSIATLASPCNILVATAIESFYNLKMLAQGIRPTGKGDLSQAKPTDVYCLDYTGTCSFGQKFDQVQFFDAEGKPLEEAESRRLFTEAACVGMKADSQHLMQKAMRREIQQRDPTGDSIREGLEQVSEAAEVHSLGVSGRFAGQDIRVGRQQFIGKTVPEGVQRAFADYGSKDHSFTYIRHGDHWGVVRFSDTLREDIIPTIRALQQGGRQVRLLTGDTNRAYILEQARKLGLDETHVHTGLTSEDKKTFIIGQQQQQRRVTMIGDGVNDSEAMTQADISYALADTGHKASFANADFIAGNLASILPHQKQAEKVTRISGITLVASMLYTGMTTLAQAVGLTKLPLLGAAFAHEGVSAAIAAGHNWLADRLAQTAQRETQGLLAQQAPAAGMA